jgi:hypothetical protein
VGVDVVGAAIEGCGGLVILLLFYQCPIGCIVVVISGLTTQGRRAVPDGMGLRLKLVVAIPLDPAIVILA